MYTIHEHDPLVVRQRFLEVLVEGNESFLSALAGTGAGVITEPVAPEPLGHAATAVNHTKLRPHIIADIRHMDFHPDAPEAWLFVRCQAAPLKPRSPASVCSHGQNHRYACG